MSGREGDGLRVADDDRRTEREVPESGRLDVFERIEDVPAIWDDLVRAGGRLGLYRSFLRVTQATLVVRRKRRYLVYRTPCGGAAIAVGELLERPSAFNPVVNVLMGRLYKRVPGARNRMLPMLVLRTEVSSDCPIVTLSSESRKRGDLLRGLLAALDRHATRAGWSVAVDGIPEEERELGAVLVDRGYLRTLGRPYAELRLPHDSWPDFLDFAAEHSKKAASSFRYEQNRARREGLVFRTWDPTTTDTTACSRLLEDHSQRLNDQGFPYGPGFLEALRDAMGQDLRVLVALKDDQILGAMAMVIHGTRGYALFIGIVEKRERAGLLYFNLAFYQAIQLAIDLGLESIAYGNGVYPAKIRRGCSITMTGLFVRPRNGLVRATLRPPISLHRRLLERKYAPIRDAPEFSFPTTK